ncbi:MAG TPA: hypothetical protein VII44_08830 [Puia sp.]
MIKRDNPLIIFLFCVIAFVRCHSPQEKEELHFEVVDASVVSDSLSVHQVNYKEDYNKWKAVYEQCMHDTLFHNAFYLGLQYNLGIGSVSNQTVQNINKQITVLDTSDKKDIFDIIAVNNSANCFSKINLNKNLQDTFYNELIRNLKNAGDYTYLSDLVDTNQITFKIGTMIDYSIRTDSLIRILQRTKDSSLLYFRQILTTPGNALFVRAGMIFGFDAQFHLKRKLTSGEASKLKNEVFFKLGDHGDRGSIQMLPDQSLKVVVSKNYTVFGQFYFFK